MWLPDWPITRLHRAGFAPPAEKLATVETERGLRRLVDVSVAAAALGLRSGQALAGARAICPDLKLAEADPAGDAEALGRLALWCERYTPLAAPDPPDGLWLDITGCAHLWHGETALAADLARRLEAGATPNRIAIAGTTGAAWALARRIGGDTAPVVLPPGDERGNEHGEEREAVAPLPVGLLRLPPAAVAALRRLGLRRIGELYRLPRADLAVRFGASIVLRLDQALGQVEEAIAWPRAAPPWLERLAFAEPIGTPEDLARTLTLLAERLCARLAAKRLGGRMFSARFFRVDGEVPHIGVATALPVHAPAYVGKLLGAKLETVDPGFGVDAVTLEAEAVAAVEPAQPGFDAPATGEAPLAAVVDALANRLGPERLWRVAPRASHVPERAVERLPALGPTPMVRKAPAWEHDPSQPRPIRLLRRPEPIEATAPVPDDPPVLFRWRGALHRVRAAAGPERIAAEWWRRTPAAEVAETDLVRDYYRVEDTEGARFWLFRAGQHGGGRTPRWFLHGLFA